MKRILSMVLIVALMITLITPVYADVAVQDDLVGHWSESIMREWIGEELISGYDGNSYKPNTAITRAEFCTLLNNVIGLTATENTVAFKDVAPSDWFYQTIKNAASNGWVSGYEDGAFYPNNPIKREEAAVVVKKILSQNAASQSTSLNHFKDYNEISTWSKEAIETLVNKGYLNGYPDGTFRAKQSITRGEAVAMLGKVFGEIFSAKGTYKGAKETTYENVTIASADVTLEDMMVKGDLYIAESVGNGDVTLNNVTVEGDIIVKGGGEHSIHFNNTNVLGALIVKKADNKIRIIASGTTRVNVTYLASGALLVEDELAADGFNNVILNAETLEGLEIELVGRFNTVEALTEGFKINLPEKSTIQQLNVNDKAVGFDVAGKGTIQAASVNANDSRIDVSVDKMSVGEKVKGVTANGKEMAGGTDANNPQAGGIAGGTTGGTTGPGSSGGSSSNDSKDDSKDDDKKDPTPLAVLTLSNTSVQMTTTQMITVTATVQSTTSSMVNANVIWVSQSPNAVSVSKNGSEVSNTGNQMVIENQLKASGTTSSAIITVYVVKEPSLSDPLVSSNVITSKNISVAIAKENTKMYTVYFEAYKGDTTSVPKQEVLPGQVVVMPVAPTKTGYTFKGWYLEDAKYDFSKPVEKDMTLKAVWEIATTKFVDDRFDTGYPKVTVNEDGYITVSLKLKNAPDSTVKAYLIADPYNTVLEPDKTAVMHGHTGSEDSIAWAKYNGYLEINDTSVHTIVTTAKTDDKKALVAIVLKDNTKVSIKPTIIEIEKTLVDELDEYPPTVGSIYINNSKTKIYVYTHDELDGSSNAEPTDFELTYMGNPVTITKVDVLEDAIKFYDAVELSVSGLTSDIQVSELALNYTGTGITDKAKIPNSFERFNNESIKSAQAMIPNVYVSSNLEYMRLKITPSIETDSSSFDKYNIKAYYASDFDAISADNELKLEFVNSPVGMGEVDFTYKIVNTPAQSDENKIYVVAEITTCAKDRMTIDSSTITPLIINPPVLIDGFSNANYFEVTYEGLVEGSVYGCSFDLKIVDSNDSIIDLSTFSGMGGAYGVPKSDADNNLSSQSKIHFMGNYYYGTLPTASSGMKVYIRYNPKHNHEYLKDISGKELKTPSDWIEVTIQ
ncbi:S-layer homology domain-containing protein [Fusibacter ferrireducens]|uniref:S-layer homology domain-containing protein n=1 Tax=Fusibacter ferrireducens TaxID=2785058 RepID=A0ABR9ZYQ9_9FIRM|nr:S-layer homology domain-containing protein [Fusibacter ferrireducens]MBF4695511.1 S-layer homology domain-containing protein [Fusibacter ferrireducens]